jgi:NAD(P) transhydrogenase subunit alpha
MRIGVPSQVSGLERRVAIVPETVGRIRKQFGEGVEVVVEAGAGEASFFRDEAYRDVGATVGSAADAWAADIVAFVRPPHEGEVGRLTEGAAVVGMLRPGQDENLWRAMVERRISALAFEATPRITRAQKCDALSSMSTVAGYRAVIRAAEAAPRFFPMLMTAAGTITPARALVLGAGVAGLQAIATLRRLGAVVSAFDVRPAVAEQVQSLGAKWVDLGMSAEGEGGYARAQTEEEQAKQRKLLGEVVASSDIVITTALIPGRPAPRLIERATIERMKPGSVIVDLAAESGGNCEGAMPDEAVTIGGAVVLGPTNLPAEMPLHASTLYSRNILAMLEEVVKDGALAIDPADELVGGALVTHAGEARHRLVREALGMSADASKGAAS